MNRENRWIWLTGATLLLLQGGLLLAYPGGGYEEANTWSAGAWIVGLMAFSGIVYLVGIVQCRGLSPSRGMLVWILAVGLALRMATGFSVPAFEDDFYRYMLDGGVSANGFNPYAVVPEDLLDEDSGVEQGLRTLALDAGHVAERVNHPWLKTVYPPIAQLAFATAHWISPWNLPAWRLVLGLVDLATLGLLAIFLVRKKLPLVLLMIYWWNPLFIKETYNSCHMDLLTLPFVIGAMLAHDRGRYGWSATLLALATGTKLWPIVLLPLVLRPLLSRPLKLCSYGLIFAVITVCCALPVRIGGLDESSGFVKYMATWEMNDGLYMLLLWFAELMPLAWDDHVVARILAAVILAAVILVVIRRDRPEAFCRRALVIIATVFLLSPTQFPWYAMWFLPFLVGSPRMSLLILTPLLPLYYMRFAFRDNGLVHLFDYGVVWIEYLPVYGLLIWEGWRSVAKGQGSGDRQIVF